MIIQERAQHCPRCEAVTVHGRAVRVTRWTVAFGMVAGGLAWAVDDPQWRPLAISIMAVGTIAWLLEAKSRARVGCMRCRGHHDAELQHATKPRLNGTTMIDLL